MTTMVWLPLAIALTVGLATTLIHRRVPPAVGAWVLTASVVGSAIAVIGGLMLATVSSALQVLHVTQPLGWCDMLLTSHHRVPVVVGVLSALGLALSACRAMKWRRECRRVDGVLGIAPEGVEVVDLEVATALAVPGRPGHIIVSKTMLDCLDERERDALFAHEQAHLDHHHHRYIRLAQLAADAVPILHPIRSHLRFCTERWADEVAAKTVGDRRVVATAITRAALAGAQPSGASALGFVSGNVAARVEALLSPPGRHRTTALLASAGLLGLVAYGLVSSGVELHHVLASAAHVCWS